MQNVHHFRHEAFSSGRVLKLEPVGRLIEPILNLLLIAVSFIGDLLHDLHGFIEILPRIVHDDNSSPEHGILLHKKLLLGCHFSQGGLAHDNTLIILEFR